jgi:hypothetical protein
MMEEMQRHQQEMLDRIKLKSFGINNENALDLTSLNIPEPPPEAHPCNRGSMITLGENNIGQNI